ncbi:MGH1-like glycoside hydrolase domain-containing protein [Streptomyces sp. NBC_00986]|uniref:alpha-L-rhamnosidase-related protein n=1 Tax=Streptomyces sp. NBC_00986 TaxID=2903702 RepID=UPI003868AFA8|nr:trehalase family glycosidase [Streptomyces sp. NBC_00986]
MKRTFRIALVVALGLAFGGAVSLESPPPAAAASTAAAATAVAATQGDAYNLSPTSRTLAPTAVYGTSGSVSNPTNVLSHQSTRLNGNGSAVTLDFGKEVGGIVTLNFAGASGAGQSVGLAFSESSLYTGTSSDNSAGGTDGAIYATVGGAGSWTMPTDKLRGGFRYLTLFLNSGGWVDVNGVSLNFTAAPGASNPAAYPDYFYSNDDELNRIWYAGAYTVQLNTIDPTQGRVYPPVSSGWENNATVGVGSEVLVDGAKRDRSVWPGDLGISLPTAYVSTDDLTAARNSLTTLYQIQKSTGELPWGGPEFNFFGSDTYHMWTLIGTSTYYLDTADKAWLDGIWAQYKRGVDFITAKIDNNGLLNVTGTLDWARSGQGGENIAANAMLYRVLTTGATLAQTEGDSSLAATYASKAVSLKSQINARLWDSSTGAYKDNPTSSLHPQDGNSLAVWYGVVPATTQARSVAAYLRTNWGSRGAQTPEFSNNISPFTGSMEVYAHFAAGDDTNALNLIRTEWGFMLDSPIGTKSTFWEGYSPQGDLTAYPGSFTSMAHGWSTGPTGALTSDVLGIAPTTAGGAAYQVVPHPGNLTHVEGTLTVATGKTVHASYDHPADGSFTLQVDTGTNSGSTGVIAVPRFGQNHTVTINGSTAWNGSSFTGATGVTSADQDADYIYFRGVQPGSYTLGYAATGTVSPTENPALPGTWTQCALEGGTCAVSGTKTIAFGAQGKFTYTTAGSGTACTTATFGDPASGIAKACYVQPAPPTTNVWSQCASENNTCAFTGVMTVAYGAAGSYRYATLSGGTPCTNAVFGDPISGTAKSCYLTGAPPTAATWTTCAAENGTCTFTGTHEVAFGANGQYFYGSYTGGTPCTNTVFGDPISGTSKSCYVQ